MIKLSNLVGYPLTPNREKFFTKLFIHSTWMGRYPVPTKSEKYEKSISHLMWSSADSQDFFEALFNCFSFFGLDYESLKKKGELDSESS